MTVLQVRAWLADSAGAVQDTISAALFSDCSLDDVKRMTDLNDEKINAMRPSQVDEVIKICKELNPHFFALLDRLIAAVQKKV